MRVYIDTEFTDLIHPRLLSIGLVADDGRELYVELDLRTRVGAELRKRCTEFVVLQVLPQFRRREADITKPHRVGHRLADWLLELAGDGYVEVIHDYGADFELLERALRDASRWQHLEGKLRPTIVGDLNGQPDVEKAKAASLRASSVADRLAAHHALADARALRAGFAAVHGVGAATHLGRFDGEGLLPHDPTKFQLTPEQLAWFHATAERLARLQDDQDDDSGAPEGAPVLFLDVDDVFCLYDHYGGLDAIAAVRQQRRDADEVFAKLFHAPAVEVLRQVHEALGGHLRYVISSTWREHLNRSEFAEVLRQTGLHFVAERLERKGRWSTPSWPDRTRLHEIAEWLRRHGKGEPFAVIDDTYSGEALLMASDEVDGPFGGRITLCTERVGLRPEHAAVVVDALRRPVSAQPLDDAAPGRTAA